MSAAEVGVVLDSFVARTDPERYCARYDRAETPTGLAVVAAVSNALGRDPVEIEPLHYAVDGEALDEVFGGEDAGDGVSVTFGYADCEVTVTATEVTVVLSATDDWRGAA